MDTAKLIKCVYDQPVLWDNTLKEYSNRRYQEEAWLEIGEVMFDSFLDLEPRDKEIKVTEMQNEWRHIRDNYRRSLQDKKNEDEGEPFQKKRKHVHADSLDFLLKTMEQGTATAKVTEEDKRLEKSTTQVQQKRTRAQNRFTAQNGTTSQVEQSRSEEAHSSSQHRHTENHTRSSTASQVELPCKCSNPEREDADRAFFISILPDIRKLDEEEKLDFKCEVLQCLRELKREKRWREQTTGYDYMSTRSGSPVSSGYHRVPPPRNYPRRRPIVSRDLQSPTHPSSVYYYTHSESSDDSIIKLEATE